MKDLRLVCYGEQAYGSESERSEQQFSLKFNYYRYEIFDFQAMINPILELASRKSEL